MQLEVEDSTDRWHK